MVAGNFDRPPPQSENLSLSHTCVSLCSCFSVSVGNISSFKTWGVSAWPKERVSVISLCDTRVTVHVLSLASNRDGETDRHLMSKRLSGLLEIVYNLQWDFPETSGLKYGHCLVFLLKSSFKYPTLTLSGCFHTFFDFLVGAHVRLYATSPIPTPMAPPRPAPPISLMFLFTFYLFGSESCCVWVSPWQLFTTVMTQEGKALEMESIVHSCFYSCVCPFATKTYHAQNSICQEMQVMWTRRNPARLFSHELGTKMEII